MGTLPLTVRAVCQTLDTIAPPSLALEDDPTGLLVGDPAATVTRLVVALDVTMPVVEQARVEGAEMVIAHHPLIYHPLKAVRADQPHPGAVVLACVRAGIAVACAHTCWDVAPGGVNDVLARLCGIQDPLPLQITCRESLVKLVVYVPLPYRETVLNAMAKAGAGAIGDYDRCAFWTNGTGTFRPLAGAQPFLGQIGRPEVVTESRLEMIASANHSTRIVAALKAAHPYEEVAYEVYPLENVGALYGIGRVGNLPEPLTAGTFLARLKTALQFDALRLVGPKDRMIQRVAVCGGAGAFLVRDAIAAGADILVTSDVRHHEFVDAAARGFLLMDAGHAATETPGTEELAHRLQVALPEIAVSFVSQ